MPFQVRADSIASAKEFVEFWLENSVHPDEQYGTRRGREAAQRLADNLVRVAEEVQRARSALDRKQRVDCNGHQRPPKMFSKSRFVQAG